MKRHSALLACLCIVSASLALSGCRTSYAFRTGDLTPVAAVGRDHAVKDRIRFIVIGDSGQGNDRQRAVAKGIAAACEVRTCDFGVTVGDNIYPIGIATADDPQLGPKFHQPYDPLGMEFWLVPGNHDWYNEATLQPAIDHTAHPANSQGTWKMPFNHYAVPGLPDWLHIYGIDTNVMADLGKGKQPEQERALLEGASKQVESARLSLCGKPGWRLLVGHHFVYSSGSLHGGRNDKIASQVEPIIRDCGVQLYISGHDHHQELLRITSQEATYHQVVQGGASEHRGLNSEAPDGTAREFALAEAGFSVVEATREHLTLAFYACPSGRACSVRHALELRQP